MQIVWIVVSLALAGSLILPRAWLHAVGIVGCSLLLWHAIELGDPAFVICQIAFVVANVVSLVARLLSRKLVRRPKITRVARSWGPLPERPAGAQPEYWVNN